MQFKQTYVHGPEESPWRYPNTKTEYITNGPQKNLPYIHATPEHSNNKVKKKVRRVPSGKIIIIDSQCSATHKDREKCHTDIEARRRERQIN